MDDIVKNKINNKINEIAKILFHTKSFKNPGLFSGASGISLFLHYYYLHSNNEKYLNKSFEIISNVFENINNGYIYHTFANGLAGIGWLTEFFEQNDFLEIDTNEMLAELDDYLYELMIKELKNDNYDYLHGASGIALYFTKRKCSKKVKKYLTEYVDILSEMGIKDGNIIKWISEINVDNETREKVFNLSMSHGIASLVLILGKIYTLGINKKQTEILITGAINYIVSQEQETEKYYSYFSSTIKTISNQNGASRLAWCYGDLGISVAIWNASQIIKNKEWENKALEILHYSTNRTDLAKNRVIDAGLCHGAAGIAHIFNRMYINTKDKEFKKAADYWYAETLKMANHKESLSGYKAWRSEEYGGWIEYFGFLEGIAGIGLTLMSAISDIEPDWDEILLLS